ncbi:hypothetical protein DAEQUDRAFT_702202 [Daedalea quercina L-15889]|uniref:Uncharacterized protein n=1 Tax=Daedalea quercina L-15889 TaxID=1314783 RepID=A0A165TW07_9APHY|nr:hypothetical protein DAEQUDRAFT_702202 [Daedalea quercina L-15889]
MFLTTENDPSHSLGVDLFRFPHPFTRLDVDTPRSLVEIRMCALSAAIREKVDWHIKFRDQKIRAKWADEIREQQKDLHESLRLTDNMINYVMTELEAHATLRDEITGIEPGPYERIWRSDRLIPPGLKADLLSAIAPLESVPDAEKDWHPGSDGKVLDLIHPSLYPIVYGRTISTSGKLVQPRDDATFDSDIDPMFASERFQWLPSDFRVADDGTVSLGSPYINNVHPDEYAAIEKVLTKVLERAVPMFEWVLSDLARERQLPTRMDLKGRKFLGCIWKDEDQPIPEDEVSEAMEAEARALEDARDHEHPYVDIYQLLVDQWCDNQPKTWPDSKPAYDDGLDEEKKTVNLRGKTLQVILKAANIVLTPEDPEYAGGKWHVEGMNNEAIVSTFIYYYDCENLTESTLSFRNAVNEPRYHGQDDSYCMHYLYGIDRDDHCVQEVGKVITKEDRCIAFPNLYQHLVSPFRLADPTRPGHRKILVFFLVDPLVTIPSASVVAPQQASWIQRTVAGTTLWERLPVELQDVIMGYAEPMTLEQAKAYREELMAERTAFVETVDGQRFGQEFNMCEH